MDTNPQHQRHKPKESVLYQVVQSNYNTFLNNIESEGGYLPSYVLKNFESYLECGILAHGFLRIKCTSCKESRIVAFSCKKRGFYPSCGGRRMGETAVHLVDEVFPKAPVRQWVLSVPYQLRYWLSSNLKLQSKILQLITRAISSYYKKKSRTEHGIKDVQTGAVTLIQRFGSAINLNVHYHILFLDGVYSDKGFCNVSAPSNKEVVQIAERLFNRITRYLQRNNYLNSYESEYSDTSETELLSSCVSASIKQRIAIGERRGREVRRIGSNRYGTIGQVAELRGQRCAYIKGYSLHANTVVGATNRKKLEHLCRYISRTTISLERMSLTLEGNVLYKLKKAYTDGTTHLMFSQLELLEKLSALVPKPRANLTRYHGVLAPNAKNRSLIVPKKPEAEDTKEKSSKVQQESKSSKQNKLSWAQLLKRVFNIDLEHCSKCGAKMRLVSAITQRSEIRKILIHLKIPSDPPELAPAIIKHDYLFAM